MSKSLVSIFSMFVLTTLIMLPLQDAEAKRFGGGASFGSKSGYGQKYQRSTERPVNTATSGPRSGGLGSMLGGLAVGGLLAALFMGGGFENINFFDIMVFGLIAFMLFKLFSRRGLAMGGAHQKMQAGTDSQQMFKSAHTNTNDVVTANMSSQPVYEAPKDFLQTDFLLGADKAYRMLQQAWDDGELAEIRGLVTDKVFAEIQQQLQLRSGMNRTEIVDLNSRLLEIRTVGENVEASVMFDCLLREIDDRATQEQRPEQVREVWHFTRPVNGLQPTWYLDGIQQLDL